MIQSTKLLKQNMLILNRCSDATNWPLFSDKIGFYSKVNQLIAGIDYQICVGITNSTDFNFVIQIRDSLPLLISILLIGKLKYK